MRIPSWAGPAAPLLLGLALAACQAQPPAEAEAEVPAEAKAPAAAPQFAYSPTITVFAARPLGPPPVAARPAAPPPGMVYVPGGYTQIGSLDGLAQEQPLFWVYVRPFLMDQHEVTVGQFRQFVQATGYRTQAEQFGNAGVLDDDSKAWHLVEGATWRTPYGPQAGPAADNLPVTQVSWNDATAYAAWARKRLPDELEWEHAARNGRNSRTRFPFGDSLRLGGKYLANTWNGKFPDYDRATDGYHHTAPVGSFGTSELGLADLSGNVWEWCANYRQPYADLLGQVPPPGGAEAERAQRGGSFLCEAGWCFGYRVSGRSGSTPETALMHVGFRCVRDL